jgi:hypothetical protein
MPCAESKLVDKPRDKCKQQEWHGTGHTSAVRTAAACLVGSRAVNSLNSPVTELVRVQLSIICLAALKRGHQAAAPLSSFCCYC